MAERGRTVGIGFLNIVATPHPAGVYERLFRTIGNRPVRYHGDNFAAITPIRARPDEKDVFTASILSWIEIDQSAPAVDKTKLEEVPLSDDARTITREFGFNSRVFKMVLHARKHIVTFESINEFGQRLSPLRAQAIFSRLLSPELLGAEAEMVDVTVIPEDDALSRVLAIKRLDRIEILLKRPNADDVDDEAYEVLKGLEEQNAKAEEIILRRAAQTEGLKLSEQNKIYARVAATNGHVTARGRDADGELDERSTKRYPKVIERVVPAGTTLLGALVAAALAYRASQG